MNLALPSHEFEQWRIGARRGLSLGVPPERFHWQFPELCVGDERLAVASAFVPQSFLNFAKQVALHKSEERWTLLYTLLWRFHHGEPAILSNVDDPQVAKAVFMFKAVDRDKMKMKAFVKFKETHELRVAWYKPEHHIAEDLVTWFVKRDPQHSWILHTPQLTVRWNLHEVELSAGLAQPPRFFAEEDEEFWLRYYQVQFDPLRERVRISGSDVVGEDSNHTPRPRQQAAPPQTSQLSKLKAAAKTCLVCPFAVKSTQTVFGEGPKRAAIMLVGEQPGDQEDRLGHPFVGPAGELLNSILDELGIPRDEVYVTNAVKHFKFSSRGKRRIHEKPNTSEMKACRPWLEKEIEAVRPSVIVALGATAAQSVTGRLVKVTKERGDWLQSELGEKVIASWHPSAILRSIDEPSRRLKREQLKADLKRAWKSVGHLSSMRPVDSHQLRL